MTETIADRIERLRAHAGLTLEKLDALSGLSAGHASQIVRGRTESPRDKTLRAIARTLGAEPAWLSYGAGEEPGGDDVRAAVHAAGRRRRHAVKVAMATGGRSGRARPVPHAQRRGGPER